MRETRQTLIARPMLRWWPGAASTLLLSQVCAAQPAVLGDTASALPGIVRIGVPASSAPHWAVSGSAGYGYTESQVTGVSAHHRAAGVIAGAYAPLQELELGLRFDGRYDWHAGANDSGLVGDPRFLGRAGTVVGKEFHLGGELGIWVPGADAPSMEFRATTLDARWLGAWVPDESAWVLGSHVGFRWDHSAKSAELADRYSQADRVALNVSDFNAVLLGVGGVYRMSSTEILAEVTGDLLVGSGAPSIGESPLRFSVGPRHHLTQELQLQLIADTSLSSRAGSAPGDPLVPLEPRFSVMAGLTYRDVLQQQEPGRLPPPAQKTSPTPPPPPEPVVERKQQPAAPNPVPLRGTVTDHVGTPVVDAVVRVQTQDQTLQASTDQDGSFLIEQVPPGPATATVTASGFKAMEVPLRVTATPPTTLSAQLEPDLPAAQIRGMIRSFQGKPLAARIVIDPPGTEVTTDPGGLFQVDVEPGTYTITVSVPGYVEQHRTLKVGESAVVVFNADLVKQPAP